jgi:hypothetical protein
MPRSPRPARCGWGRARGISPARSQGDHDALVETLAPEGQWWAPRFPGATYAARLTDDSDLLGVFEVTDTALLLRGVVSPADGAGRTELTYDPAVEVLRFPLRSAATWTTTSTVSGVASGVPGAYTERYDSQVDASGELITPFATFPVLRVRVVLTRTVGLVVTTVRTFAFVTECFGTVASVRSRDNETSSEFTRAAEARRLAP